MRPPGISSAGTDFKDLRLSLLPELLGNYDIVCLQELFAVGSSRRSTLLGKLASQGLSYSVFIPAVPLSGYFPPKLIDGGVTIVSRYPITSTKYHVFSTAELRTADAWTAKGVLYARVQVPSETDENISVDMYTTHMQAHDAQDDRYSSIRYQQTKEMIAFVNSNSGIDKHVVIAGDFNVNGRMSRTNDSDGQEYLDMMRVFENESAPGRKWVDVLKMANNDHQIVTGGDEYNVPKFGSRTPKLENCSKRLDYIMVSQGMKGQFSASSVEVLPCETPDHKQILRLSDHMAVSATLKWS
eukprot:CFRG4367T1